MVTVYLESLAPLLNYIYSCCGGLHAAREFVHYGMGKYLSAVDFRLILAVILLRASFPYGPFRTMPF